MDGHVMLMTPILVYPGNHRIQFLAIPASNIEINCLATSVVNQSVSTNFSPFLLGLIWGLVVQTQHQRIIAINGADVPPYERMSLNDFIIFFPSWPPNSCY